MSIFKQLKYVFKIQFLRSSGNLTFFAIIQILISLGIVVGFTYLFAEPDPGAILYLATGAPTIILIMTGLVILPQHISNAKVEGYVEFTRTWPVNRATIIISDTLLWLSITIPGIVVASIVAHFVFNPGYAISWTIAPALLLTALTSIGVGYGFSYGLPPNGSLVLSQILVFGSLMFSPINFPMERLPEWLQALHNVLPLYSMAEIMRASMAATTFTAEISHYINLTLWCVVGYGGAIYILNKK